MVGDWYTRGRRNLLGCVNCEGKGPEPVVVGALRMVEEQLPRLGEFVPLQVQLMEQVGVEGYVK